MGKDPFLGGGAKSTTRFPWSAHAGGEGSVFPAAEPSPPRAGDGAAAPDLAGLAGQRPRSERGKSTTPFPWGAHTGGAGNVLPASSAAELHTEQQSRLSGQAHGQAAPSRPARGSGKSVVPYPWSAHAGGGGHVFPMTEHSAPRPRVNPAAASPHPFASVARAQ
jgi:hypothetical protein